ncbi:MAG: ATP-dependent Clp protease ATP-binding subunit ClpC [Planctomycetota bacterium]
MLFGDADMPASQRKGVLCQRLAGQPFAVLLLDEFEKASSTVHDRFLQLFDEGEFINGAGDTVSCRSLIIIATSNTGAEVYRGGLLGFAGGWNQATIDREIERHLQDSFRFEFLNRFDRLVAFSPLDRETIREIALRELRALEQRSGLRRRGLKIELDDGVIDWLSVRGYHPDYGARFLHRTIEREVSTPVAGLLVRQVETEGRQVALSVRAGRVHARLTPRIAPLAARQAQVAVSEASGAALSKAMDRAELARQGRAIVEAGDSMLPEFELRRAEYESLLVTIGQPDFWSRERDDELLERFRVLDVSLQVEGRHLEAIESLREELDRCERESTRNLEALARAFEAGTDALDAWRHRRASEGEGSVWMIISRLDPLREGTDVSHWIRELVRMECAWCKAQGLEVTPVAIGPAEGDPLRVALLVEGPGSQSYLAMEEGEHRMHREGAGDLRAKVEVCVRNARPTSDGGVSQAASARDRERGAKSAAHDLRAIRSRGTVINDLKASHTISLALEKRGRTLTFLGAEPELMLCLMDDLARAWDHDGHAAPELARIYGASGRGASDPRTEASVARLKDVLKGRLERFFDAWCSRSSN